LDKLDKIGKAKVMEELLERGFTKEAMQAIEPLLILEGTINQKLERLRSILSKSEKGLKGLSEVELMLQYLSDSKADISRLDFDVTLARGLSYYTGAIFEVKVNNVQIGS